MRVCSALKKELQTCEAKGATTELEVTVKRAKFPWDFNLKNFMKYL